MLICTDVMARGVHWVIQYDPPSSAASFVRRSGHTARIDNEDSALVILLPSDVAYVDFIYRNQKVRLVEIPAPTSSQETVSPIRSLQLEDRAIMDKSVRAFVSHIQAYAKHECNVILRLKDLNLGKLATGFGLLKLPRMPELKGKDVSDFEEAKIDFNSIPYKCKYSRDRQKEESQQEKLKVYRETGVWPKSHQANKNIPFKQTESWSFTKQKKLEKKSKRERRRVKKQRDQEAGVKKRKRKKELSQEDVDELAKDIALIKKLKRKKISQEEFDKKFDVDSEDSDVST